jgi:hypothetical membrane protein
VLVLTGRRRLLAIGGIVGPVAFVSAWALCGWTTPGYSPVSDAISDLARVGADTRVGMTSGFVVFGIGVAAYSFALRWALTGPAWMTALATAIATLGVAAVPLGWFSDGLHGAFAGIGYLTLALTPILASRSLTGRVASVSLGVGLACGLCLLATVFGPAHGLFQRIGLGIGDAWVVASAVVMLRSPDPSSVGRPRTPSRRAMPRSPG